MKKLIIGIENPIKCHTSGKIAKRLISGSESNINPTISMSSLLCSSLLFKIIPSRPNNATIEQTLNHKFDSKNQEMMAKPNGTAIIEPGINIRK